MTVGHIGINVTDIEVSKAFYMNLFGFEVLAESQEEAKKYLFLGNDGKLLLTLWQQSDKSFSTSTAGLHHLAFVLKDIQELQGFEQKLTEQKVEKIYDGIVSHAEGASSGGLFFLDPDGVRLEVYITQGVETCKPATSGAPSCGFF